MSSPIRGTWIEISRPAGGSLHRRSSPIRGTWIEILLLSWPPPAACVVPHTGDVDRNCFCAAPPGR